MATKDNANPIIHALTSQSIRAGDIGAGYSDGDEWWHEPTEKEDSFLGDRDGFALLSDAWARSATAPVDSASDISSGSASSIHASSSAAVTDKIDQQEVFGAFINYNSVHEHRTDPDPICRSCPLHI